jgi:hypothetical protein
LKARSSKPALPKFYFYIGKPALAGLARVFLYLQQFQEKCKAVFRPELRKQKTTRRLFSFANS